MAWTKLKTAVVVGAIAILAVGTSTVTIQHAKAAAKPSAFIFAGYASLKLLFNLRFGRGV